MLTLHQFVCGVSREAKAFRKIERARGFDRAFQIEHFQGKCKFSIQI